VQTNRTIPNNKPDIIICDNEKETCMSIVVTTSGNRNVIAKEAEKILKTERLYDRKTAHVKCKNESDTCNNRGNWNHLKIVQKIPEEHFRRGQNLTKLKKTATLGTALILWKVLM
jgi:hypothetical protein